MIWQPTKIVMTRACPRSIGEGKQRRFLAQAWFSSTGATNINKSGNMIEIYAMPEARISAVPSKKLNQCIPAIFPAIYLCNFHIRSPYYFNQRDLVDCTLANAGDYFSSIENNHVPISPHASPNEVKCTACGGILCKIIDICLNIDILRL